MPSPRFDQKVAIITGASRGIGQGIALRLAEEGARVVLVARDRDALDRTASQIREAGGTAGAIPLDLRTPDSAQALIDFAIQQFEGIDLLVNNAGATKRGTLLELSDEDFADGFALKFFGAARITRAAWPHLKARGGSVIMIAGVGGKTPGAEFAAGGSVNAALLAFTKSIAELGLDDGVRVNLINPGTIRTARYQVRLDRLAAETGVPAEESERAFLARRRIRRIGEPAEVAALVAFLASEEASLIHGSLIDIDAGATKSI